MSEGLNVKFWTICLIRKQDEILLLDRKEKEFPGLIPPRGKVEFPESFVQSAIREVKEETGLDVWNVCYKGLYEYVNPAVNDRFIIFHYITSDFEGDLLEESEEGKPQWVKISELEDLPMQSSIRRRIPLLLEEGIFEVQVEWDQQNDREKDIRVRKT
ncbi:8-oxo-dGTP diphosphatase [Halobacillus litoralis]|uniref:8-oxo-dGTP diphosphatase n=1 Tax=Halobacillus litoralis TaxID=45668 RepID=UPI001CD530F5|nr:8-oxo-dGTP diphosphatase [Halobacillus litoralis]MCA0969289.1 8-oxo-dGTP diphosphatase [Halobacillus litoralis]